VSALLEPQDCGDRVRHWLDTVEVVEREEFTARFPAERLAVVTLRLKDGSSLCSETTAARGGAECPLSDDEVFEKFHLLASTTVGRRRSEQILRAVVDLAGSDDASSLLEAVLAGADQARQCRSHDPGVSPSTTS